MADKVTKEKRSEIMRAIKSKNSQMELLLRKELSRRGYRYKKNVARLVGKPDIAFVKERAAIFLDSCFWHGCRKHCRLPASNKKYWREKIERNKKRDTIVSKMLKKMGWKVARVWEHDVKKNPAKAIGRVEKILKNR